eukprot:gene11602-biopygen2339
MPRPSRYPIPPPPSLLFGGAGSDIVCALQWYKRPPICTVTVLVPQQGKGKKDHSRGQRCLRSVTPERKSGGGKGGSDDDKEDSDEDSERIPGLLW